MELRALAEQILFATTLEEKLQSPAIITDDRPGSALLTPEVPGRPRELRFKPQITGKAEFPGTHQLESERERGRLLHFFANHELLATELMALVLLRFPDAPTAFRKGVLQTLCDEQEHTRLYIQRMRECGIQFGELPVSGYFWRTVSPMENPMDYVASLCLTFEQANLDFARHFASGFAKVGDDASAKLLGKIYRDEIGHVAYGLKWFRRWKNPNESDWEAFCRTLKFPLSPQRAKGFTLNVAGRRAAGFDLQFIAELDVYSQSKGRTPSVFVFNPFAEGYISQGKSFNATKHQVRLARDLENLPQFLCRQDDIVLVREKPSVGFLSGIKQAGFPLPEFVEMGDSGARLWSQTQPQRVETPERGGNAMPAAAGVLHTAALQNLTTRKLGRLRPWAWGTDSVELFRPLFANVSAENRTSEQRFNANLAQFYSKAWSAMFLKKVLERASQHFQPEIQSWLCSKNETGMTVSSLNEASEVIATIRDRGHHKIVVKEAFGLAGSNALRLFEPTILEGQRRWMENAMRGGRPLVVEPWLERVMDFSIQLEMTANELKLCGFTGLLNDAKGQFLGNWAESHHHTRIPAKIVGLFKEPKNISRQLLDFYAEIFKLLQEELRRAEFVGPIGIDAFVYRDTSGALRLKPIVEINPRYTMGRVTVELMKQTFQGSYGQFRLINRATALREGFDDFSVYARSLNERFPIQLEGEPAARIREGVLCLNDPARAQTCLAIFQVSRTPEVFTLPVSRPS